MTLKTDYGSEFEVNGQILKIEENFVERKTFCSKCVARDIKLSSFLGGNPSKILIFTFSFIL